MRNINYKIMDIKIKRIINGINLPNDLLSITWLNR